jgi:superfamily II DNA/RNA helicase
VENKNILSILKLIGSGKSVLCVAQPNDYTSIIPELLLEIIPQPEEGSPRAIVICKDIASAVSLYDLTVKIAKTMDLTVDLIHDKGNKLKQRNDLFDGTEIIIGTPKRICELYFQNGFNIGKLKIFMVLEMDDQMRMGNKGLISRIAESLPKCRQLIFTRNAEEERTVQYIEQFANPISIFEFEQ